MVLEDAYKLINRYGINLNTFGPRLSLIDNKCGICIPFSDKNFGFLNRNFPFDNEEEFSKFLKRYSNYKNNSNDNSYVQFDDYLNITPGIIYSSEEEQLKRSKVKKENIKNLTTCVNDYKMYIDKLYKKRMSKIKSFEKIKEEASNRLIEYKKNLYKYYNKEYLEEIIEETPSYRKEFKKKFTVIVEKFNSILENMFVDYDLDLINTSFNQFFDLLQEFEVDEDYFGVIFDIAFYNNKITILDKMNNCLLEELDKKTKNYKLLKIKLENMKSSNVLVDDKESFVEKQVKKIKEKYSDFASKDKYNFINYLANSENVEIKIFNDDDSDKNEHISDLLKGKRIIPEIVLLFSPLKDILLDYLNSYNVSDVSKYLELYNSLKEKCELPVNVIICQKYFKNIDFSSFQSFCSSVEKVAIKIQNSSCSYELSKNVRGWSYDYDKKYVYLSTNLIKDYRHVVYQVDLSKRLNVFYSKARIQFNPNDVNSFIITKNDDLVINKNNDCKIKLFEEQSIKDFEFNYTTKVVSGKKMDVATDISKEKIYKYCAVEIRK